MSNFVADYAGVVIASGAALWLTFDGWARVLRQKRNCNG